MTLAPTLRTRLWGAAALAAAAAIGWDVANESWLFPVLAGALAVGCLLTRFTHSRIIGFLLAVAIAGNIVGNRGFAQLYLSDSLPLLPAEFILMVTGTIVLVKAALERRSPFAKTLFNAVLLLWLVLSAIRLPVDFQQYGFLALRDFVTVGYSLYFFIGEEAGRDETARRLIAASLLYSSIALLVIFPLFTEFQDFFLTTLTLRGTPVVYYKGDLAGTFLAVGCVVFQDRHRQSKSWIWIALALMSAAEVIYSHNRASALALLVGSLLLAVAGQPRLLLWLTGAAATATILIILAISVTGTPWTNTPLFAAYEEALSVTDPAGVHTYTGEDTEMKGDNNAFRLVWWKITLADVWHDAPVVGKGWGYDLAAPFEQIYYPEAAEELAVRSPHDILITLFARGGFVSLLGFLAVLGAMARCTYRSANAREPVYPYWVIGWMIFTSACFGVVLEGPMGAVIFWSLLGVAYAHREQAEEANASDAALPAAAETALPLPE